MSQEVYKDLQEYKFINNPAVAYYSVLWGYPNLLTVAMDKKHSKIVKIIEGSFESKTLLHFASQCDLKKKNQIAHLLLDYGLSEVVYQNTILHLSVQSNDLQFTKTLLEQDTSANFIEATDAATGNTVLHIAVKEKNAEIVKLLLQNDCNVKAVNNLKEQPKHLAVQLQHLEILQMLLFCEKNSVDVGYYHQIMLHYAVETANIEIINCVLDQNVNVNYQDEYGKTALHIAAEMGNYESVKLISQHQTDFDIRTKTGLTVLHCAILGNNTDVINMCLKHTENINIADDKGEPPLFYAIRKGSIQVVKLLLDNEASIDSLTKFEEDTALHVACATYTDDCEIVQILLDKKVKIDAKNKKEETPLIVASQRRNVKVFRVLLDKGADITKTSTSGINIWSFLSNLQIQKHKDTINLILEKGANPNLDIISVDPLGKTINHGTPLSKAIANNCWDMVEKLLQYRAKFQDLFALKEALRNKVYLERLQQEGLQLKTFDKEDLSRILMQIILHEQRPESNMRLYLDNELNINAKHEGGTSLHLAVALGKSHIVKWLLQNKVNVNATNSEEETALHLAVANKQLDMIYLLVKNGADINCSIEKNDAIWESLYKSFPADCEKIILNTYPNLKVLNGFTPLYYAVDNNNDNLTRRLIEKGADVNDSRAFKKAIQRNNTSIIQLFLERGYQPNNTQDKEIMPLAGSIGNCNVIDLLLRCGFKVNSTNNSGETALFQAAKNKHFLAAKLLILREADVNCSSRGETLWDYFEEYDRSLTDLILKKGAAGLGLNKSNQNSLLHYAIRNCDEVLVNFLLKSEVSLDFNDPSLKAEAILRKNPNVLQALGNRGFKTTTEVLEKVKTCLIQRRSVEVLRLMQEDYEKSEADCSSLYKLLHLAVYLGHEEFVQFVFKTKFDLDYVDIYNSLYPLHFGVENGVLKQELLMEKTKWIKHQYMEEKLWKLEDMRKYVLQRYPLDRLDFRKKHKYSYLTERIQNNVSKTMTPPLESRYSVLKSESHVKLLERSISAYVNNYVNYWFNHIKNVAFRRSKST